MGADLSGVNLLGANLAGVLGLTQKSLDHAWCWEDSLPLELDEFDPPLIMKSENIYPASLREDYEKTRRSGRRERPPDHGA